MSSDDAARLLVFRLGAERFALALDAVDEVIDAPASRPMPDTSPSVLGVATLHGAHVTIYDPRAALDVAIDADAAEVAQGADDASSSRVALLFRWRERRVGLVVDDVYDAMTVAPTDIRGAPGSTGGDGLLLGVIRRSDELIAVLDPAALLSATTAIDGEAR